MSSNESSVASSLASSLKHRLAGLSPEELATLQRRLRQERRSSYEAIRALPDEADYPLSLHQQRLWFIEQFRPGTPLYNVTRAVRMRGKLNVQALHAALQSLVDRHEALRTTFESHDGEPRQRVRAPQELELPLVDLREVVGDRNRLESLLQQRLTDEGRRTFDLSSDLMLRTVLYQLTDDEHVLQTTIHHLACDGWSLEILFRELSVLYRGFSQDQPPELPALDLRYVDFSRWQREARQAEHYEKRVRWWHSRLDGAPHMLDLATDRPRPQVETGHGSFQPFDFPPELIKRLEALAQQENATLYMILLAGFLVLLHRYTGMDDFLVGSAIAGRQRPELQNLVGFFVDTVVVRADLAGAPTARDVLRKTRQQVIDSVEHSDVPFERIVKSIDPAKDIGGHPLFQVIFNAPPHFSQEFAGLVVSPVHVDMKVARFDLEMTHSGGLNRRSGISWSHDLFDVDTIQRMLRHYRVLLNAIVEAPDTRVRDLPLLTQTERRQLLSDWNDVTTEYPRETRVHELFEQQAEETPDTIAVVSEDQKLTYRELNERANTLAASLRQRGVGRETLVGICVERSLDSVIGVLGILKAGGAYVPLDSNDPPQRLEFMLRDANVEFLVTQRSRIGSFPDTGYQTICIDTDESDRESSLPLYPRPTGDGKDLAYVMYTSGSSGRPKAVCIPHRAIVRLVQNTNYVDLSTDDCIAHLSNVAFDAATFEIWGALLCGGRLAIGSQDVLMSSVELAAFLRKHGVTTLFLTTALFNQHVLEDPEVFAPLKQLLFGGETANPETVRKLLKHGRPRRLLNVYGPTECTTFSTWHLIEHVRADATTVPIGNGIGNSRVYVLDPQRNLLPIGIPGELYIGGDGLALGYLNRPELTAEKFVANNMDDDLDSRLYRTGDLCRWRADGTLEFVGRCDQQVKLRGFRIELGEIESVILGHPSVDDCVVILREDRPGDKRLIAYFIPAASHALTGAELTRYVRDVLPNYMVPSAFVGLEAFPLMPSGKVNRRRLPAPGDSRPELSTGYVAPRNPIERELADIWGRVLGLDRIGIHDNFFDLGGHSLLSIQLRFEIKRALGVDASLATIFLRPTVEQLSSYIAERGGEEEESTVVALNSGDVQPPVFCICGIGLYKRLAAHLSPLRVYGVYVAEEMDLFESPRRFKGLSHQDTVDLARKYVDLIVREQPQGPYFLAGVSYGGMLAYEIAQQLVESGKQVAYVALLDTSLPGARRFRPLRWLITHCRGAFREGYPYIFKRLRRWLDRHRPETSIGVATENSSCESEVDVLHARRSLVLRAQAAHYEPRAYPGRVHLFKAKERGSFNHYNYAPGLGWDELAIGGLEIEEVPGGHVTMLDEPYVPHLAACLKRGLEAARHS